jgi:hypothetical protein
MLVKGIYRAVGHGNDQDTAGRRIVGGISEQGNWFVDVLEDFGTDGMRSTEVGYLARSGGPE